VLLNTPEILQDVTIYPVVPYTVLHEIDGLKKEPELRPTAQKVIKYIYKRLQEGTLEIVDIPNKSSTPDERIVQAAEERDIPILTGDIGAMAIASSKGVKILNQEPMAGIDHKYTGYQTVDGDVDYDTHWIADKTRQLVELEEKFQVSLKENEYLIVNRLCGTEDIWVRKGGAVNRVPKSSKPFREAGIMIDPLDAVQACALNAVFDSSVPLTIIEGRIGSGKTTLAICGALACTRGQQRYMTYDRILVTRPNIAADPRLALGYRPGEKENKLGEWLGGILSNLEFLYERSAKAKEDKLAEKIFEESFEMLPLETIQGVSIHNSILLVDEYQLLDSKIMKMVLSRIATGSKVVLMGDPHDQTYGINLGIQGYRKLGSNCLMSYVRLDKIYRSDLANFVHELYS
jgi:predicted ribonuclease YlaK